MSQDLRGQAGIVTGAGKGIGAAIAAELALHGASVVALARTLADVEKVAAEIRAAGGIASAAAGDVRRFEDVERLVRACEETYGRLDFAVANAGIVVLGDMAEGDPGSWATLLETNVLGTAYTARASLPIMKRNGSGHIVIVSSQSGRVTYTGEPMYVASKWALSGLGGSLRKEASAYGVRVTLIEPGTVDTPMVRASEQGRAELARNTGISPNDCARAVAYALCQPANVCVAQLGLLSTRQADWS